MLTFEHPHAPTVTYNCELPKAIASYATDHLNGYDVYVVEVNTELGVTIEVFNPNRDSLGLVRIH